MYAKDMLLGVCRTAVLRKLGHASKEGVETLKGRMACMISTWGPCAVQNLDRQAGRHVCHAMSSSLLLRCRSFLLCRTSVLRKLGHVTKEGVVTLKGRAACEISTGDELLATELMFNGVFNSLDKHQLVALISCLVPVEKSNVSQPLLSMNIEKVATKACVAFRSTAKVQLSRQSHPSAGPGLGSQ